MIILTEYLTINSYDFATPAAIITDHRDLFRLGVLVGESWELGGVNGRRPNPLLFDEDEYSFPVFVDGRFDIDGNVTADAATSLKTHVAAIHTALTPNTSSPYTRLATWHQAGGTTLTAQVQAVGFDPTERKPGVAWFDLRLRVPAGRFA